jgi:hypothetical protein
LEEIVKIGQRVYWHGLAPRPAMQGKIVRTGTIRHEVLWDGRQDTSLEYVSAVAAVSKFGECCAWCAELKRRGQTP